MTAIRVAVTAEHIAGGAKPTDPDDPNFHETYNRLWAVPVERALGELTGQEVDVSGDGYGTCVATIGTRGSAWTVVIDLPDAAIAWLNARWETGAAGEPFTFEIEVPEWVRAFVGGAT